MAMSSGKSSSMAAMLLLAVVVAGTCASGAQVQYSYDIISRCEYTVFVGSVFDFILPLKLPRGNSVHTTLPPVRIFRPLVEIGIASIDNINFVSTKIEIPASVTSLLEEQGGKLQKIEIRCEKNCITLFVTNKPPGTPPVPSQGPFCTAPPSCPS